MPVRKAVPRAQATNATDMAVPTSRNSPTPPSDMLLRPTPKSDNALRHSAWRQNISKHTAAYNL